MLKLSKQELADLVEAHLADRFHDECGVFGVHGHPEAAHLTYLHQLPGVLSAALVYQHNEDAEAMSETIYEEGAR